MKNIYLILIITIFVLFGALLFTDKKGGEKDFIDLDNSYVVENESSVNRVNITDREMIQVKFSWEVNGTKYNDALYFSKDEHNKLTEEDIQKMKEERFVNWAKTVNAGSKQE